LGESIVSANQNMSQTGFKNYWIEKADLTEYRAAEKFDVVYSIGVLHHLKKSDWRIHFGCWKYEVRWGFSLLGICQRGKWFNHLGRWSDT
jgi:hypothetical protein